MGKIGIYEINPKYITYLASYEPKMFQNKRAEQKNTRKYIGVVFQIEEYNYFAPLSSFKVKHSYMKETLDFIKIKNYAVINLNNMFPVPMSEARYIDINKEKDTHYRALLMAEYRYIKSIQEKIYKNSKRLYNIKKREDIKSPLSERCNNFLLLEKAYIEYVK